jgi:hypothetical protein
LPALTASHNLTYFSLASGTLGTTNIVAFYDSGESASPKDEIIIGLGYDTSGGGGPNINGTVSTCVWSTGASASIFSVSFARPIHVSGNPNVEIQMPYATSTRVASSSPTTTVGQAVTVIPLMTGGASPAGVDSLLLYPSPAAPTVIGAFDILAAGTNGAAGPTIAHQARIVSVVSEARQYPSGYINFNNIFYELVNYTDPPNSETWPVQHTVFGPEYPFGYGGVASVSAGELFMVKQRGGAFIVQGDINNPTVTTLPGVQPTGPFYGRAGAGNGGMYYCSLDQGAFVWNGGNTAQKVSTQIDDAAFTPTIYPTLPCYGYFVQRWGEWMMFSNNWILNTDTGGWWRLDNPSNGLWYHYTIGVNSNLCYTSWPSVPNRSANCFGVYDKTQPTNSYQWQCLPIRPSALDRTISAREVTVRASNPTLDANAQITVSMVDNAGTVTAQSPWTLSATTRDVQIHNFRFGVRSDDLVVRLNCTGTSAAPAIFDLVLSYRTREQAATF